jgi:hypothetical protein
MEVMTAEQAAEAGKDLDFAKVWAALMENREQQRRTDEQIAKMSKEMDKLLASGRRTDEQQRRTDEQIAKTSKEVAELSKNIDREHRSPGGWTEETVAAKLWEKFEAFGYEFTGDCQNLIFRDGEQTFAAANIFLESSDYAMSVKVGRNLSEEDIDDHLDRIGKIRLHMDRRGDKRRLVGAVAGAIVPDNVRQYAQKKGLYVVVQSGDSIEVASMPKGFEVREW